MKDSTLDGTVYGAARPRATKACLACRARKVRCDAVHRQGQCTNCALDGRPCEVKPRPTKYHSSKKRCISNDDNAAPGDIPHKSIDDGSQPRPSIQGPSSTSANGKDLAHNDSGRANRSRPSQTKYASPSILSLAVPARSSALPDVGPQATADTHVIYSYYPFLKADLSLMSEQDVRFLDSQGCFKIPGRQAVDQFIREYFLHVHSGLPLLDESAFWKMYSTSGNLPRSTPCLSLFVFQAILFVSCSFLLPATIRSLGFESTRSARATYYRRAKLLFDFGGESDSIANAQGALLLSYNASMRDRKRVNSLWLATAIQLAEDKGAHLAHLTPVNSLEENNALKRLWWCCIIRDRILPLGVRRKLHISFDDGDLKGMALTEDDFRDEINDSRVYDNETKRLLVRLFIMLCDLAGPLGDVILTIYPSNKPMDISSLSPSKLQQRLDRIQSCKHALQAWFERAIVMFPTPASIMGTSESLILYTNLMYIYYHSARLALYQHEALIYTARLPGLGLKDNQLPQSIVQLEDAAAKITEGLKELIQLKLARYLPISVVAFAAVPLVLHIVDVKLSTTPSQIAQRQGQLNIYMQAMEGLQAQYDGTDEVWLFIRAVVDSVTGGGSSPKEQSYLTHGDDGLTPNYASSCEALQLPSNIPDFVPATSNWGNMLLQQPALYFRLTHTIDLSLSMGRYPEDSELPVVLRATRLPLYQISIGDMRDRCGSNRDRDALYQWDPPDDLNDQDSNGSSVAESNMVDPLGNPEGPMRYDHADLGLQVSLDAFEFDFGSGSASIFPQPSPTQLWE